MEIIFGIVMSLITGFVSGAFASICVTRLTRFVELRGEAQRIVRFVQFMVRGVGQVQIITTMDEIAPMINISSDFFALGHKAAGEGIMSIYSEIGRAIMSPPNAEEMARLDTEWQRRCRELQPAVKSIIKLNLSV